MSLEPVFLVGFVGNGATRKFRYSDHAEVQACRRAGDKRVESRGAETSLLGSCAGSEVRRDYHASPPKTGQHACDCAREHAQIRMGHGHAIA